MWGYKVTVNAVAKLETYPLPKVADSFAALSGGVLFSKLDLSNAYQQLILEEDSRKYTNINTTKGLFQYLRLPLGISSAPSIFQRTMETLLRDIPGVVVYIDDILVAGHDTDEHYNNLNKVMMRLEEAGVQLKQSKCFIGKSSIEYLGHIIDKDGLHPAPEKVRTVQLLAPELRNITELRAFLGLLNYYSKFCLTFLLFYLLYTGYYKQRSSGHGAGNSQSHFVKQNRCFNHLHCWFILIATRSWWYLVTHLLMVLEQC